jgi:hypothetical protein
MWSLSHSFFTACEAQIGKSKRYLYKLSAYEKIKYNRRWRLVVPVDLMEIIMKGVDRDADV